MFSEKGVMMKFNKEKFFMELTVALRNGGLLSAFFSCIFTSILCFQYYGLDWRTIIIIVFCGWYYIKFPDYWKYNQKDLHKR